MIQRRPEDKQKELKKLRRVARLLDEAVVIPGTKFKVGVDSLVGLLPVAGDIVTAAASGYFIHRAQKLGVRKSTLAKMYRNVALDLVVGSIPLVGDLFDVAFKSNSRNLHLLEKELEREGH